MATEADVEAIEIHLLLEAIHARYGFDLREYAPSSMRRRVRAALARSGLEHLGALQHHILSDAAAFAGVLDDLTVRVTEMFRDPSFYRGVRERVLPILRTYPHLKIWHGGCASGEEAYATAILLSEEGLYERAQIYATDLNPGALEHARQGVYAADRFELFAENHARCGGNTPLSSYGTLAYGQFAMHESLKKNILFFQHDLVSDHVFGEMHVIFCRNVFIYFDVELRKRVVDKFTHSLYPGGFLCLGSGERLPSSAAFPFSEFAREERIYRYEG
jgi:chemotaxis protein methyltransferase CheR